MVMWGLFNLFDKVRRYFVFSKEELKSLVIAILILGFVVGFDDGQETFVFFYWMRNMFSCILIVALAIIVREAGHRIYALQTGHRAELRLWWFGLITALILAIISFGKVTLLIYGGIIVHFMPRHRIGYFRYELSYNDMGLIALLGNIANLVLAFFFKLFMFLPNTALIEKAILINILMACMNMIPIPPLDGSLVLYASRSIYVFTFGLILAASALLLFTPIIVAAVGSIVIAIVFIFLFQIFWESK